MNSRIISYKLLNNEELKKFLSSKNLTICFGLHFSETGEELPMENFDKHFKNCSEKDFVSNLNLQEISESEVQDKFLGILIYFNKDFKTPISDKGNFICLSEGGTISISKRRIKYIDPNEGNTSVYRSIIQIKKPWA